MSVDLYSTPNWLDGQGIDLASLIGTARFVRAQLTDQILENLVASVSLTGTDPAFGGQNGANSPTSRAYALSPGGAYLRAGSANNKIQIAPGTLLQKLANADGLDSTLVPYEFAGTEEFTLTNGDATNPRVDLLQMALAYTTDTPSNVDFQDAVSRANTSVGGTNTRRRIQCTLSVKAGTPAASPTIPEPDAGCVPVGTVMVGNGWTTGGTAPIYGIDTAATNNAVVHDQRIPLGMRSITVHAHAMDLLSNWSFAATPVGEVVGANNATNEMYAVCPFTSGRLLGVTVTAGTFGVVGNKLSGQTLARRTLGPSGLAVATQHTLADLVTIPSRSGDTIMFYTFEANHSPSAGPTVLQSATTKIGMPLWANGRRCPFETQRLSAALSRPSERLLYRIVNSEQTATGPIIYDVTFHVAEGL